MNQQEKEYEERKSAFNKTVEQCVQENDIKALAIKYADSLSDLDYVKSLNEDIATRYAEMLECYPTPNELRVLIDDIEHNGQLRHVLNYRPEEKEIRLKYLRKFLSALTELEKQNINHTPENYTLPKESDQQ